MADFTKFIRLSLLVLLAWAFPVLLIVLGSVHSNLLPGLLIGLGLYFAFLWKKQ